MLRVRVFEASPHGDGPWAQALRALDGQVQLEVSAVPRIMEHGLGDADLIVWQMDRPGADGIDGLVGLMDQVGLIPVIATLRDPDPAAEEAALRLGVQDCLIETALEPSARSGALQRVLWRIGRLRPQLESRAAVQAGDFRRKVLRMAAHDLRTPLTPLLLNLEIYERRPDLKDQALQAIRRSADRLVEAVDRMLEAGALESGSIALRTQEADLDALVEGVVTEFRDPATASQVRIRLSGRCGIVQGDPAALTRVMRIVLQNAIEHSPAGGLVSVAVSPSGLHVTDEGPGFWADQREAMFAGAAGALAEVAGVRGLSLFVARSLMRLHGGDVEAKSAGPGRGATFTIRLAARPWPAPDAIVTAIETADAETSPAIEPSVSVGNGPVRI